MELARRTFDGGCSVVEIDVADGALNITETDWGPVPSSVSGGRDVEYVLRIGGEPSVIKMLSMLGEELGEDLVVLLDDAGLARLRNALIARFGSGLNLLPRLRDWLSQNEVPFRAYVL